MIEFQRLLLGDTLRNDAFADALKAVIKPGETVIADIGSGTGFLSFLAERYGAKACHLYEVSDLLTLSKTLAKENGCKRCQFFHTHSTAVKKPLKADVVVSEILGNYALEENIIETLNDAQRFLKPGGVIIPHSLTQFVAPVISSRLFDELNVWDRVGHDVTFRAAKEMCMNNMYVKDVLPGDLWGKGQEWDRMNFAEQNDSLREASVEWTADKNMTFYGFTLWWESALVKDITISTSPLEPSTHWKQIYLPTLEPLSVEKGGTVRLHMKSDTRYDVKINLTWETALLDMKGKIAKTMKQDMRKGYIR